MSKRARLICGVVALPGVVGALFFVPSSRLPGEPVQAKAAGLAKGLGIHDAGDGRDFEKSAEQELEMLRSGEAVKDIEREIEKAETLAKKYASDTEEHKMLSRRIAMLKRLKEKIR
ncbi:MAG: hypothetical protein HY897_18145 [Deltaproteobacteria bacterium]|nr:hypothetical protein [Deltaproteobacteria bacterium]